MADHLAIHARSAGLLGLALALEPSSVPELQEILLAIDGLLRLRVYVLRNMVDSLARVVALLLVSRLFLHLR